jgi:plasmid stability protein
MCGLSLYQYDHIDPPWANAREHRPEAICLLCPNHHERKNKGLLSIEEITAAYAAPKAKRAGYSHDPEFRVCRRPLKIRLGNVVFDDPTKVLRVAGEVLLEVADLEDGHLALNGRFYDCNSRLLLEIYQNEWRCLAGNWDVEHVGTGFVIREMATYLSLRVVAESAHSVTFDNIAMEYLHVGLVSSEGGPIEISYKGKPTMVHWPGERGGIGIETKGFLDIDASGCLRPLSGPTTFGAGTLEVVGSPPPRTSGPGRTAGRKGWPEGGRASTAGCVSPTVSAATRTARSVMSSFCDLGRSRAARHAMRYHYGFILVPEDSMASLTLKDIPGELHAKLKADAETHGRSLNKEILLRLKVSTLQQPARNPEAILRAARSFHGRLRRKRVWVDDAFVAKAKRSGRP